jgi:hypothetical protein
MFCHIPKFMNLDFTKGRIFTRKSPLIGHYVIM